MNKEEEIERKNRYSDRFLFYSLCSMMVLALLAVTLFAFTATADQSQYNTVDLPPLDVANRSQYEKNIYTSKAYFAQRGNLNEQ